MRFRERYETLAVISKLINKEPIDLDVLSPSNRLIAESKNMVFTSNDMHNYFPNFSISIPSHMMEPKATSAEQLELMMNEDVEEVSVPVHSKTQLIIGNIAKIPRMPLPSFSTTVYHKVTEKWIYFISFVPTKLVLDGIDIEWVLPEPCSIFSQWIYIQPYHYKKFKMVANPLYLDYVGLYIASEMAAHEIMYRLECLVEVSTFDMIRLFKEHSPKKVFEDIKLIKTSSLPTDTCLYWYIEQYKSLKRIQ